MPSEATISMSLAYAPSFPANINIRMDSGLIPQDVEGGSYYRGTQAIPTVETAINLGTLATVGLILIVNRDPVGSVKILTGVGGVPFPRILPGKAMLVYLDDSVTAPAAISVAPSDVQAASTLQAVTVAAGPVRRVDSEGSCVIEVFALPR